MRYGWRMGRTAEGWHVATLDHCGIVGRALFAGEVPPPRTVWQEAYRALRQERARLVRWGHVLVPLI